MLAELSFLLAGSCSSEDIHCCRSWDRNAKVNAVATDASEDPRHKYKLANACLDFSI